MELQNEPQITSDLSDSNWFAYGPASHITSSTYTAAAQPRAHFDSNPK
jgi:hypothetical protein